MYSALRKILHMGWCLSLCVFLRGWGWLHPRRVTTVTRCSLPPSGLGQVGRHGDWVVTDFVTSPLGHHAPMTPTLKTHIRRHTCKYICTWHMHLLYKCWSHIIDTQDMQMKAYWILHTYMYSMYSMRSTHTYSMHAQLQPTGSICASVCVGAFFFPGCYLSYRLEPKRPLKHPQYSSLRLCVFTTCLRTAWWFIFLCCCICACLSVCVGVFVSIHT